MTVHGAILFRALFLKATETPFKRDDAHTEDSQAVKIVDRTAYIRVEECQRASL